jgi:predicted MFS family arabinose efflux permease
MALLSFLHGIAAAFSLPALQSLPPRIVDEEHVARTNALVSLTDEFAIVAGPVVGGLAIAAFGFQGAFVVDALTYAVGLAALPLVRVAPLQRDPSLADDEPEPEVRMRDALEGARLIRRSPSLRPVVLSTFLVHTLYGVALLSEPLYVRDVLERSPGTFAALQTAFGIFMVAGGIYAARLGDRIASLRFVLLGVIGSGITAVLYLGTPWVVVAFVGVCLWGACTALISGPSRTVLQRGSPQSAHGRVLSTDLMAGSTGELVGIGLAGLLVTVVGVQWTAAGIGFTVALAAAVLGRRSSRAQASASASANSASARSQSSNPSDQRSPSSTSEPGMVRR